MQPAATIVGSGPNGLAAAIVLAEAGYAVNVREAAPIAGGATRTAEITLPGFLHDLGSAVHPFAVASPFFSRLPLAEGGLRWISPPAELAHPLDDGTAVTLERGIEDTSRQLGEDEAAYRGLYAPLAGRWEGLRHDLLAPIGWPRHPLAAASFGWSGFRSARAFAEHYFKGMRARALFAGLAAHSFLPLEAPFTAAFGLLFGMTAHTAGWPIPLGGARSIAGALMHHLHQLGGTVQTDAPVKSLRELASAELKLLDVTPAQFLSLGGSEVPPGFRRQLERYVYGPGVFKVDWALSEPIPWRARECLRAGTVHLGGTFDEIAASERAPVLGGAKPFVLLAQPTLFDPSRAPAGKHVAWAYCHVPNGWKGSALEMIESQVERFAPGFRECILGRAVFGTAALQAWNENLVGGDINGGSLGGLQLFVRPTRRRYSTPLRGVYFCSSSTPPGGGVHGMCGYWAARKALRDRRRW